MGEEREGREERKGGREGKGERNSNPIVKLWPYMPLFTGGGDRSPPNSQVLHPPAKMSAGTLDSLS